MKKFNDNLINDHAIKRCYPGATTKRLRELIQTDVKQTKAEKVLICVGTNNITKTNQCPEDIANEIVKLVESCRTEGVKDILVSSLICRPEFDKEITEINKMLGHYAGIFKFTFINNSRIKNEHLWKDGVHLCHSGIPILATNYVNYLNRPPLSPFNEIWH